MDVAALKPLDDCLQGEEKEGGALRGSAFTGKGMERASEWSENDLRILFKVQGRGGDGGEPWKPFQTCNTLALRGKYLPIWLIAAHNGGTNLIYRTSAQKEVGVVENFTR